MTAFHLIFAAAAGAGALSVSAAAQDSTIQLTGGRPQFLINSFGSGDSYGRALLEAVVNMDYGTNGACAEGLKLTGEEFFPLRIVDETLAEFAGADGYAFHEAIRTEGCGDPRINNVYVFVTAEGGNRVLPSFPGRSLASLRVQIQAYNQVSPIAAESIVDIFDSCAKDGEVPPAVVRGVQVLANPAPTRDKWSEVWTFYQCERVIPLFLHFDRGESGITIEAEVPQQTAAAPESAVSDGG